MIVIGIPAADGRLNGTVADAVSVTAAAEVVAPEPLLPLPPSPLPSSESRVLITAVTLSSDQSQGAPFNQLD